MKKFLFSAISLCVLNVNTFLHAQVAPINWLSFEKAVELNKKAPKKMFIDVYTDWCGWCKRMDATTFKDSSIAAYLNDKYYAVKLDAERKDTVIFDNRQFIYKPEYKSHELALSLLQGKMAYPSFVILDEKMAILSPLSGYQQVDALMKSLFYFGDNVYQSKSWEDYSK